jgi:hypothetical protein
MAELPLGVQVALFVVRSWSPSSLFVATIVAGLAARRNDAHAAASQACPA